MSHGSGSIKPNRGECREGGEMKLRPAATRLFKQSPPEIPFVLVFGAFLQSLSKRLTGLVDGDYLLVALH